MAITAKYPHAINDTYFMNYATYGSDPHRDPMFVPFPEDEHLVTPLIIYKLSEWINAPATLAAIKTAEYTRTGDAAKARYRELKMPRLDNWHTSDMDAILNIYLSEFVHTIDGVRFNITLALQDYKPGVEIDFTAFKPQGCFAGLMQDKFVKTCTRRTYSCFSRTVLLPFKLREMLDHPHPPVGNALPPAYVAKYRLDAPRIISVNRMHALLHTPLTIHMLDKMVHEFAGYYHPADLKDITPDFTSFPQHTINGCMLVNANEETNRKNALVFWDWYASTHPDAKCLIVTDNSPMAQGYWNAYIKHFVDPAQVENIRVASVATMADKRRLLTHLRPDILIVDNITRYHGDTSLTIDEHHENGRVFDMLVEYQARFKICISEDPFPIVAFPTATHAGARTQRISSQCCIAPYQYLLTHLLQFLIGNYETPVVDTQRYIRDQLVPLFIM
jgi:hypothetical protein